MRSYSQNRPTGNGPDADFHSRNQKNLQEELQFFDSPTVKFRRTTRGITADVFVPPSNPQAPASNFNLRGEYSPDAIYALNDFVTVTIGMNVGVYIRITSLATVGQAPWLGNNFWMQWPASVSPGLW